MGATFSLITIYIRPKPQNFVKCEFIMPINYYYWWPPHKTSGLTSSCPKKTLYPFLLGTYLLLWGVVQPVTLASFLPSYHQQGVVIDWWSSSSLTPWTTESLAFAPVQLENNPNCETTPSCVVSINKVASLISQTASEWNPWVLIDAHRRSPSFSELYRTVDVCAIRHHRLTRAEVWDLRASLLLLLPLCRNSRQKKKCRARLHPLTVPSDEGTGLWSCADLAVNQRKSEARTKGLQVYTVRDDKMCFQPEVDCSRYRLVPARRHSWLLF